MDTQITWYCPIANITTSATRTCSFQPPVHAFRVLMNKNASPPKEPGKILQIFFRLTCSCAKRWVWSCTTLGITPLFSFHFFFICFIFMPKAQAPYIIKFPPEELLLSSGKVSTKLTWPLEQNNSFEKRHGDTALSLPIHRALIFWTHRKGQKTSSAPSFPISLVSLPRLKIRRELAYA